MSPKFAYLARLLLGLARELGRPRTRQAYLGGNIQQQPAA
jgi:hypothetical protein